MHKSAPQLSLFPASGESLEQRSFAVRVSKRAKRIAIRVFPRGKVEVVVPSRTRARDVEAFVTANREWIDNAQRSFASKVPDDFYQLPASVSLPGAGFDVAVEYRPVPGDTTVRYRQTGKVLVLSGKTDDVELCCKALRRWLSIVAKAQLGERLRALSGAYELDYKRLQVRAQRTCWGSHSSNGTISLNLCALFLDPRVVRYLLLHELCHGRHMNHSGRFWKLVGKFEPEYKSLDRQLSDSWTLIPGWVGIY